MHYITVWEIYFSNELKLPFVYSEKIANDDPDSWTVLHLIERLATVIKSELSTSCIFWTCLVSFTLTLMTALWETYIIPIK